MKIQIQLLSDTATIPSYAYDKDAGIDLYSDREVIIHIGQSKIIQTGIAVAIPNDYFGLIRPRSGMAQRDQVTTCSSGVIDPGYRGEVNVQLINLGFSTVHIYKGYRIAQMLIIPIERIEWDIVEELPSSHRGIRGHGSSGI